jgi:hypothetical protein
VFAADGRKVSGAPAYVSADHRSVRVALSGLVRAGYTVRWRMLSSDGHVGSGLYTFGYGVAAPPPTSAYGASGPTWADDAVRWAYFVCLALVQMRGVGLGRLLQNSLTALKVAAATPTLPPMPRRAVSIPSAAPVAKSDPGKDEALLRRAESGDLKAVQALLLGGTSPEARDPAGFTPLMLAVIHGHPAIVDALIAGGARVNVQNGTGLTPLMMAAINNHSAILRTLIDRGADLNARTHAGWTALTYGAWRGHAHIVRVLLARGADPNVTDREGWTILQYASWRAAEPISNDDRPELSADSGRPTGLGPGHAEVVTLLRQAGVKR